MLTGTVTNDGTLPVQDVAYVSSSGGDMIGRAGRRRERRVHASSRRNFNGSSASDQVYGFGGFDSGRRAAPGPRSGAR